MGKRREGRGKWVAAVAIVAILVGAGALFVLQPWSGTSSVASAAPGDDVDEDALAQLAAAVPRHTLTIARDAEESVPIVIESERATVWYSFATPDNRTMTTRLGVSATTASPGDISWTWGARASMSDLVGMTLTQGTYYLRFACSFYGGDCTVTYTVEILPEGGPSAMRGEFPLLQFPRTADCPAASEPTGATSGVSQWRPKMPVPDAGTYLHLEAPDDQPLVAGKDRDYTPADSRFRVQRHDNGIWLDLQGDAHWSIAFMPPTGCNRIVTGAYDGLFGSPRQQAAGVFEMSGEGRSCSGLRNVVVDEVRYDEAGFMERLLLRFEQACGSGAPVYGQFAWTQASDDSPAACAGAAPGPGGGALADWQPKTSPSGSYVVWESPPGEFVGGGTTSTWTPASGPLTATFDGHSIAVRSAANNWMRADFVLPDTCSMALPGMYGDVQGSQTDNPLKGNMEVTQGSSCSSIGAFVIDEITFDDARRMTHLVLRFEQHCLDYAGMKPAVMGKIVWDAA